MRQILPLLLILMFAEFTCAFETSMVVAGMAEWARITGSPATAGWMMTSYMLVAASASVLGGRLGDLYGRREVLTIVLILCAVGSIVSALSGDFYWIVAGRALQGLSGAIIPLVYALVRERFPLPYLSICIGAIVATAAAGAAVGLLAGGMLADHFGPQSVFEASFFMTALAALSVWVGIPALKIAAPARRVDILGGIYLAPGIASLLLAISNIQVFGLGSPWVYVPAILGGALLLIWVHHERRHPDPLIDLTLLLRRESLLGNLILACLAAGSFQATLLMSLLIQQPESSGIGLGANATMVGIVKFPAMIAGLGASLAAGHLAGRHGPRPIIVTGTLLTSVALLFGLFFHNSLVAIGLVVLVINCGVLAVYAGIPLVILAAVPAERVGEATGMMSACRFIFSASGSQILVVLLAADSSIGPGGAKYPSSSAYMMAIFYMLITAGAATVLSLRLAHRHPGRAAVSS